MDKLPEGAFRDNAFTGCLSLGKGQLSSILETPKGYAIIFVEDIRKLDIPSFAGAGAGEKRLFPGKKR